MDVIIIYWTVWSATHSISQGHLLQGSLLLLWLSSSRAKKRKEKKKLCIMLTECQQLIY